MIQSFLLSNGSISRTRCETGEWIGRWTFTEAWCTASPIRTLTKQVGRSRVTTRKPPPVRGQRCARCSTKYLRKRHRPRTRRRLRRFCVGVMWSQNCRQVPGFVQEGLGEGSLAVHCQECVYKNPSRRARSESVY